MCFLLGGLRFREQIYNSTVTQMSACLLSLSVISLVLPTAFHASFSDTTLADEKSLVISRGTSIILLLVYLIYLVFQLKSHAYMYESTPQELIDAEATPGPAVAWFDSSSSDDSSSSSSDSDSSGQSRETMTKRMKRMVRHPRRRKSSMASMDTMDTTNTLRTRPSHASPTTEISLDTENGPSTELGHQASPLFASRTNSNEDADSSTDGDRRRRLRRKYKSSHRRNKKQLKKLHSHSQGATSPPGETIAEVPEFGEKNISGPGEPRRVDFAVNADNAGQSQVAAQSGEGITSKRPFDALLALKPVAKNLTPTVFAQQLNTTGMPVIPSGPVPRVRYGIRRTNSLPGRLNEHLIRAPGAMLPPQLSAHAIATATGTAKPDDLHADDLSRVSALLLLLISTGLVAVCAEFMVDSINGLVETSNVSELFIGLIVLPIVGNAAEHVTAITVAMKNKMDLAIGVAVGSSIQIALFMTPLVVIIGWCMQREMTLYFTLFETVCLFVSAFIANFLVLDGRSNYLEGALLCATYVIIGLVSFFYPNN
ncbi:Sodium/calcium exchanger protein-domain-containing protein [Coniella lustricola]|uniref:Sodium/calcium exchanger protein-domain-containing protein n=1 Tax=Coniella lustricola TaxID=2025994 RepID=A0A2T3A217_9PEZI|nr:Sodium/calcium exchanger protein-domain-containing protein [Coniella lustricola]